MLASAVAEVPSPSVRRTVKGPNVPAVVGVPVTAPPEASDRPGGRLPETSAKA